MVGINGIPEFYQYAVVSKPFTLRATYYAFDPR
jgi:hypothetical protein